MASPAGESDGGWWFVCLACDHLWDQRLANPNQVDQDTATAPAAEADAFVRAAPFWWRLVFRRATSFVARS
jgi:hypothetical protein